MRKLSRLTIILGAGIVVSASFVLQLNQLLNRFFDIEVVKTTFYLTCLLAAIACVSYMALRKMRIHGMGLTLLVFILAYALMERQLYFAEKTHVVEYGLLGFFASRDGYTENNKFWQASTIGILVVIAVALFDEGFQSILPYRVFEYRDIVTNIVSGVLGIIQYNIWRCSF